MNSIPWKNLDPGIKHVVRALWLAGFDPTDSGDGVSKNEHGRVFDYPHVVCDGAMSMTNIMEAVHQAERVLHRLHETEAIGPGWKVEGNYSEGRFILFFGGPKP